jgi:predicted nuclease with TOPRIM domain
MSNLRYIKTFEKFSTKELVEEEISFKDISNKIKSTITSEVGKAIEKFKSDNSIDMEKLKKAEKSGEDLEKIQSALKIKLESYKKDLISKMKNGDSVDNMNDIGVVYKSLRDIITNVDPKDKSTMLQKIGRGTGSGMPGSERRK